MAAFTRLNSEPELWYSLAGELVQIPPVGSIVCYFPQGHVEHASQPVNLASYDGPLPPLILCRVLAVDYLADRAYDDVCARFRLLPLPPSNEAIEPDDALQRNPAPPRFWKAPYSYIRSCLHQTQRCADNNELDQSSTYSYVHRDVHNFPWGFNTVRSRSGVPCMGIGSWNRFLTAKRVGAEDAVVNMEGTKGGGRVGVMRAKRMSTAAFCYGLEASFVAHAVMLAVYGMPFEVYYYPRVAGPEFVVKAGRVEAALRVPWEAGMRVKVPFEKEGISDNGTSDVGSFTATVASIQDLDHVHWPDSPWRCLQVTLYTPDSNVFELNPWTVKLDAP